MIAIKIISSFCEKTVDSSNARNIIKADAANWYWISRWDNKQIR